MSVFSRTASGAQATRTNPLTALAALSDAGKSAEFVTSDGYVFATSTGTGS